MYSGEVLLACIALTVVAIVLIMALIEHFERRVARRVSEANREVVKDIAELHGEAKTLLEFTRLGLLNAPGQPPAPLSQPPSEIGEQLREVNAQLRELTRAMSILAAPPTPAPAPTPPPTAPVSVAASPPAVAPPVSPPVRTARTPVSARVLDAVLTDNLTNSLTYLHEHGGSALSEHEIPGSSQAVAKLLSLRLARADDQGIYLTEAGHDIANLLLSVNR